MASLKIYYNKQTKNSGNIVTILFNFMEPSFHVDKTFNGLNIINNYNSMGAPVIPVKIILWVYCFNYLLDQKLTN